MFTIWIWAREMVGFGGGGGGPMFARRRRSPMGSGDCAVEELELTSMAAEGGEEGDENGLTNSLDSPSNTMKEDWSVNAIVLISCLGIYTCTQAQRVQLTN